MELFLSSNNGLVIGSEQSISEFNGLCDRWAGRAVRTVALEMSAVTTELWFLTSGFESAHK